MGSQPKSSLGQLRSGAAAMLPIVAVLVHVVAPPIEAVDHEYEDVCRLILDMQPFQTGESVWQRASTTRNEAWLTIIGNALGLTDDDLARPNVVDNQDILKDIPRMLSPFNDSDTWDREVVADVCQAMHNLVTSGRVAFARKAANIDFGYSQVWPRIVGVLQQQLVTFPDTLLAFANLLDSRMGRFAATHVPSYYLMQIAFFETLSEFMPDVFNEIDFNVRPVWPDTFLLSFGHGYFSKPVLTRLMDEYLCSSDRDGFWIRVATAVLMLSRDAILKQELEDGIRITYQMTSGIPGDTLIEALHNVDRTAN